MHTIHNHVVIALIEPLYFLYLLSIGLNSCSDPTNPCTQRCRDLSTYPQIYECLCDDGFSIDPADGITCLRKLYF